MIKFISAFMLWALSSYSLAAGLTLTASQSEKINLDTSATYYSLAINLPSDLEADSKLVSSIFDGAIELVQEYLNKEDSDNLFEVSGYIEKGQGWVFPVKQAVQPNPVITAAEFHQLTKIQLSDSSKYKSDRMTFVQDVETILRRYFDETEGVEVWRTGFKHPISLIPQMNPFQYSPPEAYERFGDLHPDQKKVYTEAYKKLFSELKNELEEKCRIVKSDPEACNIDESDLKVTDRLLKTTPLKHYFLELFVEAKW